MKWTCGRCRVMHHVAEPEILQTGYTLFVCEQKHCDVVYVEQPRARSGVKMYVLQESISA